MHVDRARFGNRRHCRRRNLQLNYHAPRERGWPTGSEERRLPGTATRRSRPRATPIGCAVTTRQVRSDKSTNATGITISTKSPKMGRPSVGSSVSKIDSRRRKSLCRKRFKRCIDLIVAPDHRGEPCSLVARVKKCTLPPALVNSVRIGDLVKNVDLFASKGDGSRENIRKHRRNATVLPSFLFEVHEGRGHTPSVIMIELRATTCQAPSRRAQTSVIRKSPLRGSPLTRAVCRKWGRTTATSP
jgi:hypothetical protein